MVKWGDDSRQESFAMQLVNEFNVIFRKKKLKLRLTPYEILPIGPEACLVEMI
jgi:phosphatidylinositol 4-kinase